LARQGELGYLLLLRHPGLAQPREIGGFAQSLDLGLEQIGGSGPQTGNARITIVADQLPRFDQFSASAFDLAFRP
jgi:hypothetical protein